MLVAQAAHRVDIIHRDIKPSNLMVHMRERTIVMVDWGCATSPGLHPYEGTPLYSSMPVLGQLAAFKSVEAVFAADDLESLVCTAFCVQHPQLQLSLESIDKNDAKAIMKWWDQVWQHWPTWLEARKVA